MLRWLDIVVLQDRREDLLREAEKERLARLALAGRARRARLYCRVLSRLGHFLINWGWRLQARYGTAPTAIQRSMRQPSALNR